MMNLSQLKTWMMCLFVGVMAVMPVVGEAVEFTLAQQQERPVAEPPENDLKLIYYTRGREADKTLKDYNQDTAEDLAQNPEIKGLIQTGKIPPTKVSKTKTSPKNTLALINAVKSNKTSNIKSLIQKKADVNACIDELPLIFVAGRNANLPMLKLLLTKANLDTRIRPYDDHLIHQMAERPECFEIAKYLIEQKGVSPELTNANGHRPLHCAVFGNNLKMVKYLVEEKKVNIEARSNFDESALSLASWMGERAFDMLKYLLAKGANPNQYFADFTPLYAVSHAGMPEMVEYLLKNGFNPDLTSTSISPIFFVKSKKVDDLLRPYYKKNKKTSQRTPYSRLSSQAGVNPKPKGQFDRYGRDHDFYRYFRHPVLQKLDKSDRIAQLKKMLECGVNPNMRTVWTSVLENVAFQSCLVEMEYLIDNRAIYTGSVMLNVMRLPISNAEKIKYIDYFIEKGFDINYSSGLESMLFYMINTRDPSEVIQYAVSKGVHVDCINSNGDGILAMAIGHGNLDLLKFLLKNGASTQCSIFNGTVLHIAARCRGTIEIVKYFVEELKMDIYAKNRKGLTPLDVAREEDIKAYLQSKMK